MIELPRQWRGLPATEVPFGLKDGRLWYVTEVQPGLACGCRCPDPTCDLSLIAKNVASSTRRRAFHFVHAGEAHGCTGRETALHRMAKEALLSIGTLEVPGWRCPAGDVAGRTVAVVATPSIEATLPAAGVRPDASLQIATEGGEADLHLEIRVAHAVDDAKRHRLVAARAGALEIDLSGATPDNLADAGAFAQYLSARAPRRWLSVADPMLLLLLIGDEVIEIATTETRLIKVQGPRAEMHFTGQVAVSYASGRGPCSIQIELADSVDSRGRVDPFGNRLPYAPGFYLRTFPTHFRDRFKTFLRNLEPFAEQHQATLFMEER